MLKDSLTYKTTQTEFSVSEISGKIIKVLVEDMSPIEYDQPLFLVDPS